MSIAKVLDHGYLKLIEHWGSDARIIEAARMSTDKGFMGWERQTEWNCATCNYTLVNDADPSIVGTPYRCPNHPETLLTLKSSHPGDAKLLRYLYANKHMTPFEMAGMVIEVQAPIFVFREWHRHRTQSYNELSARYTPLPDVNYMPTVERLIMNAGTNKQAQGTGKMLTDETAEVYQEHLKLLYDHAQAAYETALKSGVPKELARLVIPVGRYSRMRASANLRNWLAFLTLRMDPAAQWEIRQFAFAAGDLIAERFPRTWSLFNVTGPIITK